MRANLLDELRKPYVVTARAKGLAEHRVILKYPVRAAMNPFISTIGYIFPFIVSGSIIVSLVLGLPTVGPLLYKALIAQDLFLAGTILLLLAILTVIGTLISDLLLMWVDPRIRYGMEGSR
jgi:peptide/nickel transport system permease protein